MAKGEVCLASFPYAGKVGAKVRPVLLLTDLVGPVPEALAAYMSSIIPTPLLATDIVLDPTQPEHVSTNLKSTTVLRLHKLATIHHSDIVRTLGVVSPATWTEVEVRLRTFLGL